jgi:hypothetical protein
MEGFMKGLWKAHRFLIVLFVGLGVALASGAASGLALPGAQGEGHGRWQEDHGQKENRGQAKKHERQKENRGRREARGGPPRGNPGLHRGWQRNNGYYRFNNDDRRIAEDYYSHHRDYRYFRQPMPRGFSLGYGEVVEPRYRRYCRPLPVLMLRVMPPPPEGFRYFLLGGNVVLLDDGYRVHDFIHIGINLGR